MRLLLICPRSRAQEVKQLAAMMRAQRESKREYRFGTGLLMLEILHQYASLAPRHSG